MIAEGWLAGQRRRAVRRRAIRLPGPRLIAAFALVVAVLAGGWLWLRDSSLVAVRRVTITGVSGPDAGRIRGALALAARNMTTLDVKNGELNTAVAPYPVVKSISVSTQFPHGMRIRVTEEIPVGEIMVGGARLPSPATACSCTTRRQRPSCRRSRCPRRRGATGSPNAMDCSSSPSWRPRPISCFHTSPRRARAPPTASLLSCATGRTSTSATPASSAQSGRRRPRSWPTAAQTALSTSTSRTRSDRWPE